jgi:hypothetical protein
LSDLSVAKKCFTQVNTNLEIAAIHPSDENVFRELLTISLSIERFTLPSRSIWVIITLLSGEKSYKTIVANKIKG